MTDATIGSRRVWMLVIVLLMILVTGSSLAQQGEEEEDCTLITLEILENVNAVCDELARNQACYGHGLIDVETLPDATVQFDDPGDLAALTNLGGLQTGPYDPATGDWGVALMAVQANLPESLPGQNIIFLLTGGVTLTEAAPDDPDAVPMQAFYFTAGVGEPRCHSAPDNLVIQSPQGTTVNLTVNGVDIALGSTAVLSAHPAEHMDILMVGGAAEISAFDHSQQVPAGQQTSIALGGDDGLTAVEAPADPTPYDPAVIQNIPLHLLPQTIEVPATTAWVNTGIGLESGQSFHIAASGVVNTHAVADDPYQEWNIWIPPTGMAVDEACVGATTRNHDCRCTNRGNRSCPVFWAPIMLLAGRVGDGEPFVVGSGGDFVASQSGDLWLVVNDDYLDDNGGAFYAIVTVFEE